MILKVIIPANHIEERQYVFRELFRPIGKVQLEFDISHSLTDTIIELDSKKIIIKDHFFSKFESSEYAHKQNIPKEINWFDSNGFQLPVIYGLPQTCLNEHELIIEIDLIASIFFMLSRWEEYVHEDLDQHQRFKSENALAVKFDFVNMPIVDIYREFFISCINTQLGINLAYSRKTEVIITHDVDFIKKWNSLLDLIKNIGSEILLKRSFVGAYRSLKNFVNSKIIKKENDFYDTFDFLMNCSESIEVKSHFFFMSGGTSIFDNKYSINSGEVQGLVDKIAKRGHIIGFHPSYNSYNDSHQWKKELNALQAISDHQVKTGRQHFLRFKVPETFHIWDDNNFEWESSMGYADRIGFRSGTCHRHNVWDLKYNKVLNLIEIPISIMEITLTDYLEMNKDEVLNEVKKTFEIVSKYKGDFVLLWHNSSFNTTHFKGYHEVYKSIFEYLKKNAK